jgi:nicotinamidase-related amidase
MAGNLGFEVVIPEDAVASIDRVDRRGRHWPAEDVHALTLAILDPEYARISDSRTVIEALP